MTLLIGKSIGFLEKVGQPVLTFDWCSVMILDS
jgi:hypothetical protein